MRELETPDVVQRLVDTAPPLSVEQRERLAQLLREGGVQSDAA